MIDTPRARGIQVVQNVVCCRFMRRQPSRIFTNNTVVLSSRTTGVGKTTAIGCRIPRLGDAPSRHLCRLSSFDSVTGKCANTADCGQPLQ